MSAEVKIVYGKDRHLEAVCDIFDDDYVILGLPNLPALRESIERKELLVAEVKGEVVGFVEFHIRKDKKATLYHIGVRKDWRKKSIGKKLIQRLIEVCKERGCHEIRLLCPEWGEADKFYKRVGFECIGKESRVNRKGVKRNFTVWRYKLSFGKVHPLF